MKVDISICVISYNHEPFIKETLDSISSQDFSGSVEVIVGIDLSSDQTLNIAREIAANYKWPIQVIGYDQRQGMYNNLFKVLSLAKGEFIAILEGDDYWFDNKKISKQFAYMKRHSKCILTGGGIKTLTGIELKGTKGLLNTFSQKFSRDDVMHANRLTFCTAMLRREAFDLELMKTLKESPHLDWPIYIILFAKVPDGYLKVFSDVFSVYRQHAGGVYSGVAEEKRRNNVIKTMGFNASLINEPKYNHYYSLYEKYLTTPSLPVPKVSDLLNTYKLDRSSVLSFYMQVYGKSKFIKVLLKNLAYLPLLVGSALSKFFKRYL